MISFKAIIIPGNQRADGTYVVNIRVTHKGKTRRLATTLVCTSADLTRGLKIKNPDILNKAEQLIQEMRIAVRDISPFDLAEEDVSWVVDRIKNEMAREHFKLDFFVFADEYLKSKSDGTRRMYTGCLNALADYLGTRHIDINAITRKMLQDFVSWSEARPKVSRVKGERVPNRKAKSKSRTTVIVSYLAHIYRAAQSKYNNEDEMSVPIPRNPFAKLNLEPVTYNGQRSLGVEVMQKIITFRTDDARIRKALDVFIVSFGLMGANMADLYSAKSFKGDCWVYQRQKTRTRRRDNAEMRVSIPEQLQPYIKRLEGSGRWWLNALHQGAKAKSLTKDAATIYVNKYLAIWAESQGLPHFTFYAARHSWATIARSAGIEKALIDECIAHVGDYRMADIYAERDWVLINGANTKVLSMFEWLNE